MKHAVFACSTNESKWYVSHSAILIIGFPSKFEIHLILILSYKLLSAKMDDDTLMICAAAFVWGRVVCLKYRRIWVNSYLRGRASKGRFRSDVRQFGWTNNLKFKYKFVECVYLVR